MKLITSDTCYECHFTKGTKESNDSASRNQQLVGNIYNGLRW